MKSKLTLPAVLLCFTGAILIAGIFFVGLQTRQQLLETQKQIETFSAKVEEEQQVLTEAQDSFAAAVQDKKDLLNYYEKKSSAKPSAVQEHIDSPESSEDAPTSVFSQVN